MFGLLVILIGFRCIMFSVFPWTLLYSLADEFSNVLGMSIIYSVD